MHQTTVRFSTPTMDILKAHCEREGIAMAQFVREATMVHLALSAERTRQAVSEARLARELRELQQRVARLEQRRLR